MRSRLCMSAVLCVGLLTPGWAVAETDAASIKQAIESYLTKAGSEMEDASISYDDLSVTEMGTGYDVAFRDLAIKNDEGLLVDLGSPRFTVREQDGDYAFSDVSVADKVTFTHQKEQESAVLSWALKQAKGSWSPLMEEFKSLDLQLGDVTLTIDEGGESAKQMVVKLGDMAMQTSTDENGENDWNQQSLLAVGPISVADPEGDGTLDLDKVEVNSAITSLNPQIYLEQRELFQQIAAAEEANDLAKVGELKDKLQGMDLVARGGQFGLVVKGLDFAETGGDQVHFTLDQAELSFRAAAPAAEETGSMGLSLNGVGANYEGQTLRGEDQLVAMLAPHDWDVNIEFTKLPVKETSAAIIELIFAGIGLQDEPMIPFPQIMAAMGQAGSEVLVDSLSLVGSYASLDGSAKATVDPASAMGAVGDATLKLIGLEKLEAAVGDLPKEMQQDIAGGLVFLKGLGAPEPNGDKVNYVYDFVLPADGNITLNGQPIGALLGGQ